VRLVRVKRLVERKTRTVVLAYEHDEIVEKEWVMRHLEHSVETD
jgi:hypothetical protein